MNKTLETTISEIAEAQNPNGKTPMKHLGLISCGNKVHIRHAPFYESCIIIVLSGEKVIFDRSGPVNCEAGNILTVPGPGSYDLRNVPDAVSQRYKAIIIPFKPGHLEDLREMHGFREPPNVNQLSVLKFKQHDALDSTIKHYLQCPDDERILKHRLSEILLFLLEQNNQLMSYVVARDNWSQRVRSILSADLAREWTIGDISTRLVTSESSLRRKLKDEDTSFREILFELRLAAGLYQLLQTSVPVYQVAYDCGYQSVSRFTSNFRKRFGVSPTDFRSSLGEKGQILVELGRVENS